MLHHEYLMHGPQEAAPKGFKTQFEAIMRYYLDDVQYYIKLTSWWVCLNYKKSRKKCYFLAGAPEINCKMVYFFAL